MKKNINIEEKNLKYLEAYARKENITFTKALNIHLGIAKQKNDLNKEIKNIIKILDYNMKTNKTSLELLKQLISQFEFNELKDVNKDKLLNLFFLERKIDYFND